MRITEYFISPKFQGKFLTCSLNVLMAVVMTLGSVAHAAPLDRESGTLHAQTSPPLAASVEVQFDVKTLDADEASAELADALAQPSDITIVSSDEDSVLEQVASESRTQPKDRLFALPFGKAVKASAHLAGGVNETLFKSGHYIVNAFKKDKIGFAIATFTLSNEIVRWVHVSNASSFLITSNIVYAILWTGMFIDKDTWSKSTRPIQHAYRKLFKLSEVIPSSPTVQDTAIKFLAGASLSMALNGGRVAIVGIDQLMQQTFSPLSLAMPFVMGLVMTAAGFSWSEMIGAIDEKEYPRSKKVVRFVMNSRSVVLSYLASSAMLLNVATYGMSPWIAVAMSGLTGIVLYANMKRFLPLLERIKPQTCSQVFSPVAS